MYQRETLGLAEAHAAIDAVIAEASKQPDRPIAVAVVDEHGDLICFARMDKCVPNFPLSATNKAYTAARRGVDTGAFEKRQRETGRELATWGDSRYTTVHGGYCIKKSGQKSPTVLGGIGVAGRQPEEDEQLALVGIKTLNL